MKTYLKKLMFWNKLFRQANCNRILILLLFLNIAPSILHAQLGDWQSQDIGSPTLTGSSSITDEEFQVTGNGYVTASSGSFHFLFQQLQGDGEIIARLQPMQKAHWNRVGLMMRESLENTSAYAMTGARSRKFVYFQNRSESSVFSRTDEIPSTFPVWLRMKRSGSTFTSYYSIDGENWTELGSQLIEMSQEIHVGLVSYSHHRNKTTTSRWDNVIIHALDSEPTPMAPTSPSNFMATASSNGIQLSWTDNADNEEGFKIERSTNATSGFVEVAELGADVITYEDTDLGANTTYFYKLSAFNADGASEKQTFQAQTSQSIPASPSNLIATANSSNSIQLYWADNADNEEGFKIERSQLPTSDFEEIALLEANANSYEDMELPASTTFYYRVFSFNVAGESEVSTIENSTTNKLIAGWPQSCGIEQNAPALVGTEVTFTLQCATDDTEAVIAWDFGDGTGLSNFIAGNSTTHVYQSAGTFTVFARLQGEEIPVSVIQAITEAVEERDPTHSSTIAIDHEREIVWAVNADNNSVTGIDAVSNTKLFETPTGIHPRTIAVHANGQAWVANEDDASIAIVDPSGSLLTTIDLPYGSKPYGVCFDPQGDYAFVTLSGIGKLLKIEPATQQLLAEVAVGPTPRGIAVSSDGQRLFVSRFISPEDRGEVIEVDPDNMTVSQVIELLYDDTFDTNFQGRGVPNYVSSLTISPTGKDLWVPSKKDNVSRGGFRDGQPLTFESTVRTIVSQVDLTTDKDVFENRLDVNDSEMAFAVTFSPLGNLAFLALQGNNRVQVIDVASNTSVLDIDDTGLAPQGLVLNEDGSKLFVQNFMSRTVRIYDTESIVQGNFQTQPPILATVSTVSNERLTPQVLRGKQIFYNAEDKRMTSNGYISCASCHLDGGSDDRVWDFTDRGEGFRNTVSLRGRRGNGIGNVHWTGNFDEIHDFENDIRGGFSGQGFMTDVDFEATQDPLGAPKAGRSEDLDALVAYVNSLAEVSPSPYKNADGTYTAQALNGRAIFESLSCGTCHSGSDYSDRSTGQFHDVGTISPTSGKRIGQPLTGFATPTLKGLWESAPYLHDGSAATLADVLTAKNANSLHGDTQSLSEEEMDDLIIFLNQIDDIGGCNTQSIIWDPISDHTIEDVSFAVSATSTSGLPVSYHVLAGPATIDGNLVRLNGLSGTVILAAQQAGDATFCPASQETLSFKVTSDCEGVPTDTYMLLSHLNGKAIDASKPNDEISQRAENAFLNNYQQWEITSLGNGYFKIRNNESQKVLSANNSILQGSPVMQEVDDAVNTPSQQWSICIDASGSFQLMNRFSNLVIDNQSSTSEGSTLVQSPYDPDANAHLWNISPMNSGVAPEGTFQLTALHSGKSMTLSEGDIVQLDYEELDTQHWTFETLGNGYVSIVSEENGEYLQIADGDLNDDARVSLGVLNDEDHQIWGVRLLNGGNAELFVRHSGKTLAVMNGDTENDGLVVQEGNGGQPSQQWKLVKVEINSGPGLGNFTYAPDEVFSNIWNYTDATGFGSNVAVMHNGYLVTTFAPDSGQPPGGILVWDVSDPRDPVLVNRVYDQRTQSFREAHAIGQHKNYIALQDGCGIQIWDLTDVLNPIQVKRFCMDGYSHDDYGSAWSLFWQAPYIYIGKGDGGFDVVDASDITNPVLVKNVTNQGNVGSIFAIGNLLVTGANNGRTGYDLFDISDPTDPILIKDGGTKQLYSISVNGNRIITSNRHSSRKFNAFDVYSFSDPSVNATRTSFNFGEKIDQLYSASQDNFIFQGCLNEIYKVDATNLNAIQEVGKASLNVTGQADHGQVTPMGNLVFVGNDKGSGSGFIVHQAEMDLKGPEVNMIIPSDGQLDRAVTSRIGLTFTDNVDLRTVNSSTLIVRPMGGAAISGKYSHQFSTVNFTPDEPLFPETTYEIVVPTGGLTDWIGNPITTTFTSTFTTAPEEIDAETFAQARMETAETLLTEDWVVYPNTTKGQISVILPPSKQVKSVTDVTITNVQGQVFKSTYSKELDYLDVNFDAPKGLYLIHIKTEQSSRLLKVLKE